ncbi:MAG TPA: cyclic dehypoxanthinyl futalosine synthase [Polyangiaceae bacterium]|nr:cyclic dehypoxanthinyl futalosine synthase [Polyangiaceae bacterium]
MKGRSLHRAAASRSDKIVLAGVSYLNSRPILDPLEEPPFRDRFSVVRVVPAEVARMVSEDEAHLGLMPVGAAATYGDIRFVRGVGIGARGKVRSVLVVSKRPLDEVDAVELDLSSRTSVVLARLLLAKRTKTNVRFLGRAAGMPLGPERDDRVASLVIGDPALTLEGIYPHVLDLGEGWLDWTGLPMVFAAWGARAVRGASPEVRQALREAVAVGLDNRAAIAEQYGAEGRVDRVTALAYLTGAIRYGFGEEERRGLARFFDEGERAGLLPRAEVRFADDPEPKARVGVDALIGRAAGGERLSCDDAARLADEATLFDLGVAADTVRRRKHPLGVVTYIVDRNVNYTNVCTTSCRFCAFYRPVGHPEGYVLSREELGKKLQEVVDAGGVQILLQGGLNPDLPLAWYEDLFRWMKAEYKLGLHALSPEEIWHISRLENLPIDVVLARLHAAGLDSVPGGGAEILVDRVRKRIAKAKCTSEMWLEVMRAAHHMGLRSSATMMYGTTDTVQDRILHLAKLRDLQDETRGFTAFFCWDFQHEQGTRIQAGETGTNLYLRTQALARLMLDNFDHVGASWVTQGPDIGEIALRFGADDFGSVMFEENVVSSAGTTYCIDASAIESRIRAAGFRSVRRNVRYDWLTEPT